MGLGTRRTARRIQDHLTLPLRECTDSINLEIKIANVSKQRILRIIEYDIDEQLLSSISVNLENCVLPKKQTRTF